MHFKTACYAYPCSVDNGVGGEHLLSYIKKKYVHNGRVESYSKWEHLVPDIGDKVIKGWDEVKIEIERSDRYTKLCEGKTNFVDKTSMKKDFDTFMNSSIVSEQTELHPYADVITELHNTQLKSLSQFLQEKSDEIKILCLIGHGISEEIARLISETPPDYDGTSCTVPSEANMTNPFVYWPLINCDGKEGLGEGYTAKSVCKNAKKGDIGVFASGFLTPEWIIEQLRKREANPVNGSLPSTLVLLVDSCYSGVWIDRIRSTLGKEKLNNTRVVVQTSCKADKTCQGECFIPPWVELQKSKKEAVQPFPFFDSENDQFNGVVNGLSFFRPN